MPPTCAGRTRPTIPVYSCAAALLRLLLNRCQATAAAAATPAAATTINACTLQQQQRQVHAEWGIICATSKHDELRRCRLAARRWTQLLALDLRSARRWHRKILDPPMSVQKAQPAKASSLPTWVMALLAQGGWPRLGAPFLLLRIPGLHAS